VLPLLMAQTVVDRVMTPYLALLPVPVAVVVVEHHLQQQVQMAGQEAVAELAMPQVALAIHQAPVLRRVIMAAQEVPTVLPTQIVEVVVALVLLGALQIHLKAVMAATARHRQSLVAA